MPKFKLPTRGSGSNVGSTRNSPAALPTPGSPPVAAVSAADVAADVGENGKATPDQSPSLPPAMLGGPPPTPTANATEGDTSWRRNLSVRGNSLGADGMSSAMRGEHSAPAGVLLQRTGSGLRGSAKSLLQRTNSGNIAFQPGNLNRAPSGLRRSRTSALGSNSAVAGEDSLAERSSGERSPTLRSASPVTTTQGKFFVPGTPDFRRNRRGSFTRAATKSGLGRFMGFASGPEAAPAALDRSQLRLLRRDAPFRQSTGRVYMHRNGAAVGLALQDLFHVALSMPFFILILLCMSLYTTVMLAFAVFYVFADGPQSQCGIAPNGSRPSYYHAFAFSMETLTTIGYGLPYDGDFWDERCMGVLVLVYFEALFFIILNACVVGVLFARVAVANRRASQIIFSDKAVIRCVRNRFYFMLQVGEASFFQYHPVVEAHVRVYAVLHEEARTQGGDRSRDAASAQAAQAGTAAPPPPERAFFQTRVMRLTNPNDELGGMMFLATPQIVSHRIDKWSPMFPPAARAVASEEEHDGNAYHFPGLVFREADREVAAADERTGDFDGPQTYHCTDHQAAGGSTSMREESSVSLRDSSVGVPRAVGGAPAAAAPATNRGRSPEFKRTGSQPLPELPPMNPPSPTSLANEHSEGGGGHHADGGRGGSGGRGSARGRPATGNRATTAQLLEMRKCIRQHIERSHLEVVIIVEAIDPHSSNTFQARHSYTAEDIVFDHSFLPCMEVANDGQAKLDWDVFHRTKESPFNTAQIIGGAHS